MEKSLYLGLIGLILLPICGFAVLIWLKVPPVKEENVHRVRGTFDRMGSPCCGDIVIWLEGNDHRYYINKDLVPLFKEDEMKQYVKKGDSIVLYAIKTNWNPFNPGQLTQPIAGVCTRTHCFLEWEEVAFRRTN